MKLVVHEEPENKDEVHLALRSEDGVVTLMVVDREGRRRIGGSLLEVQPDGRILRVPCVGSALGFQLVEGSEYVELIDG